MDFRDSPAEAEFRSRFRAWLVENNPVLPASSTLYTGDCDGSRQKVQGKYRADSPSMLSTRFGVDAWAMASSRMRGGGPWPCSWAWG